ncbi:MAG: hypothetical protein C0407_03585, partial [Desulfobacca sp.]|nr:hypothetical protein [Desulfobacca sp.]
KKAFIRMPDAELPKRLPFGSRSVELKEGIHSEAVCRPKEESSFRRRTALTARRPRAFEKASIRKPKRRAFDEATIQWPNSRSARLPPGVSPGDRHSRSAGSRDMKINFRIKKVKGFILNSDSWILNS